MTDIFYKDSEEGFLKFIENQCGKKVCFVSDFNTHKFALDLMKQFKNNDLVDIFINDKHLVPNEKVIEEVKKKTVNSDLILCVGSGSLNDVCKYISKINDIPCATLATACSMDGYLSKGSALMLNNKKTTLDCNAPIAILVDADILMSAPREMTAAGFGDIVGKYTALSDWRLSNILNNESINFEAYNLMKKALDDVVNSFDELLKNDKNAYLKLIDALIVAGTSMAICGNSRPASGSEHHISHYLEMDFNNRGLEIPPHGVKVAMGCLVSIDLYNYLRNVDLPNKKEILKIVEELPSVDIIEKMLNKVGCPTKFSDIGVNEELLKRTLINAYKVRERFTILTLFNKYNLWNDSLIFEEIRKHL